MHGFPAMASTILDEVLGFRPHFIEYQLAHAMRDSNGRAYNRAAFLPKWHNLTQDWADYLDQLRAGEKANPTLAVLPVPAVGGASHLSRLSEPI